MPPRKATRRPPPPLGMRSRSCSKSQTRPRTARPGYSSTSASAVSWVISLGDVDRDVGGEAAGVAHRAQQVARLRCRARAELDQGPGLPRRGDDLSRAPGEDLALGAGRVVLGQLGDLLEELGAALVVEVLGRQLLRLGGQAEADVARHREAAVGAQAHLDLDRLGGGAGVHRPASLAQRKPEKIWRRCGRSQLRKLGRMTARSVAQEPPRRTLYSSPKKTSEYSR